MKENLNVKSENYCIKHGPHPSMYTQPLSLHMLYYVIYVLHAEKLGVSEVVVGGGWNASSKILL